MSETVPYKEGDVVLMPVKILSVHVLERTGNVEYRAELHPEVYSAGIDKVGGIPHELVVPYME